MRYVDEFRDGALARELLERIRRKSERAIQLMEVCGTHTMSIARSGIKALLPENVRLLSGPGCPVCVTPQRQIDQFIELGTRPDTILATFGDMLRVPGSNSSLEIERAKGTDVRIVYSPLDAVELARSTPEKEVIFFGIGFETTAPAVALSILEAERQGLRNYRVLCAHKLIPPALAALAADSEINVQGFICPGHVSTIIGSKAYEPVARDYGIPCVVAGFEPLDILQAIYMLISQVEQGKAEVGNQYSRAVSPAGNHNAIGCIERVFEPSASEWRGLGIIPASGLGIRAKYEEYDALALVSDGPPVPTVEPTESPCECGAILKGIKTPRECRAFATACTPETPLGPCMVSSEGACAAEFNYSSDREEVDA